MLGGDRPSLGDLDERVTVCIPTCDGAAVVGDAIESVLRQTRPADEVLIVDDASVDDTAAVCRSFDAPQLRVVEHPTRLGIVANHNLAVELATGPWVKLLGQDDVLHPECLERMLTAAVVGTSLVVCGRRYEHLDGGAPDDRYEPTRLRGLVASGADGHVTAGELGRLVAGHRTANVIGEPVAVLARRDALLDGGGFADRFVQLWDYERWLRIAARGGVVVVPDELVVFRTHDASASATNHRRSRLRTRLVDPLLLATELAAGGPFAPLRADVPRWRWWWSALAVGGRGAYRALRR
jgi:glycosyltransferase involved in cell wall biosynthesis